MEKTVKIFDRNLFYRSATFRQTEIDGFYRREILKLSQGKIAELTGLYQPNISRHENGRYSETVHIEYEEMGVEKWWESLSNQDLAFLDRLLNHDWRKEINTKYPGLVPVPMEGNFYA